MIADDEGENVVGGADQDDGEESWAMCEEFIKAMLTNLERLPAERIQEMLAMTFESYDKSLSELIHRLHAMVAAEVVVIDANGSYSLNT